MKKLSVALVALAAFCGVAVAQAKPTEGPKVVSNVVEAQKLGEQRFKLTEQVCQVPDAYKASDATWMGDMPEDKFKQLLRTCAQGEDVADTAKPDETQQWAQLKLQIGNDHRRPGHHHRPRRGPDYSDDGDNYGEVRRALQSYDGPLWKTRGSIRNRYMNKEAPDSAVPCKPLGYNHIVLCAPRNR